MRQSYQHFRNNNFGNFIPTNTRLWQDKKRIISRIHNSQSTNKIPLFWGVKSWATKQNRATATRPAKKLTCGRGPSSVKDTALLNIGAESDADLVEIAAEDGTRPDGGSVPDGDLAGEDHVGCHVSIDGHFGEPLPQRDYLPLPSVVPFHPIRRRSYRFRCLRSKSAFSCRQPRLHVVLCYCVCAS